MANSYNIQVLRDGFRNFVVRVTGEVDLTVAIPIDIPETALTSVATMNPPCAGLRVMKVVYSQPNNSNLDVQLWWNATTPELFYGMSGGDTGDFNNFGGLTNNAAPGATGDILFATSGVAGTTTVTNGALTFACIVECVKINPVFPL